VTLPAAINCRNSLRTISEFIRKPPFTNQLYHTETIKHLEAELDSLRLGVNNQDTNHTINTFKRAIRKRPDDWFLHNKFADYLAEDSIRKYEEALEHYLFVMKAIPHDPDVIVKRGVVLAKLGKLHESINHFQKALIINPELAKAYFNLGLIYQKLKKMDLTVENYKRAVLYEPTHSKAYNNLAFIYSNRGEISKALKAIEAGLKVIPKDILLNYNKAMILYKSNRRREAIKQLQYVRQLVPNEANVQDKLDEWLRNEK
jgi:superkiller protein 3